MYQRFSTRGTLLLTVARTPPAPAAKRRKNAAHGASRGRKRMTNQPRRGERRAHSSPLHVVILSVVAGSRSESATESKDPCTATCRPGAARYSPREACRCVDDARRFCHPEHSEGSMHFVGGCPAPCRLLARGGRWCLCSHASTISMFDQTRGQTGRFRCAADMPPTFGSAAFDSIGAPLVRVRVQ